MTIWPSKFVHSVCLQVRADGHCPNLCRQHGSCLLTVTRPQCFKANGKLIFKQPYLHTSQAKRRSHEAHRILAATNQLRHNRLKGGKHESAATPTQRNP